jgi:hypothetical protein
MIFRRNRESEAMRPDEFEDSGESAGVAVEELALLRHERLMLIELCLYARDRVSSAAVGDRIDAGLTDIGITPLRPDGERFDPAVHEAAATVSTDDPSLHDLIAETEVPGYADRGVVVRPPVVSVYRMDTARVAEP